MTTNNASPFKLKNPTEYHLMATQQVQQQQQQQGVSLNHLGQLDPLAVMEDQHLDFSDCYTQQHFLSPTSSSPPLQDFDDLDSLSNGLPSSSAAVGNMMIVPDSRRQQQRYFFPSQIHRDSTDFISAEESPSDYSSSVDVFSNNSHPSSFLLDLHRHNSISSQQDVLLANSPAVYSNARSFGDQPFSAPAHMGYELMGHMGGLAAYHHQTPNNTFSSSLAATGSRSLEEYESIQINHQLISEKKRRRRESHNAVERRRRENINERIQELGTMLPETMLEELASVNINGSNNNKPNKGAILRKSVDHIRILQQEVTSYRQRIMELEQQLSCLNTA